MKKISLWLFILTFTVCAARGQDAATQQQLDKLSGQIQDLIDARDVQIKRMDALEKEVNDLRDKLNQPAVNNYASADDVKKLAAQIQEIDQKRQADNEQILKTIAKLGKIGGTPAPSHQAASATSSAGSTPATGPQKGYNYTIASGDTISAVAKAYRAQGVKVTTEQIMAANPGLDATKLSVGQKIFIPDPNAK
jgi:LysM repeat protein